MRLLVVTLMLFGTLALMATPATMPGEGAFLNWGQSTGRIQPIPHGFSFVINTTFSVGCGFIGAPLGGVGAIVTGAACGAAFSE